MSLDLVEILKNHVDDSSIGHMCAEALRFIGRSNIIAQNLSADTQSSMEVSKLYKFRKKTGYAKKEICGLDGSIESLGVQDVTVRLGHIDTDQGIVAIWFDSTRMCPVGIMILAVREQ